MENKFKVGDKVRVIDCHRDPQLHEGDTGVITYLYSVPNDTYGYMATAEWDAGAENKGSQSIWLDAVCLDQPYMDDTRSYLAAITGE